MGLCSQKGEKKKTTSFFLYVKNEHWDDDDSGKIYLLWVFQGFTENCCVIFYEQENKGLMAAGFIGASSLQDFVIGTYWVISLVATQDSLNGKDKRTAEI